MSLNSTFSSSALVLDGADGLPSLVDDLDLASTFSLAEKSAATLKAYRSDAEVFDAWCRSRGILQPLPSSADVIAAFLAAEARRGVKASTIGRRAAAIRYAHRASGLEDPTQNESVRRVLRGIRRTLGSSAHQKAPATAEVIAAMISHCPRTLTGIRDRALLAFGFAGAFRRSEIAALDVSDLDFLAEGVRVRIRRSKTDQEGAGQEVAIPHGRSIKPVDALRQWLDAAGIEDGAVFRPISRSQNVRGAKRLTPVSIARIIKAYAHEAGFEASEFSGHSLRAGFVTTAADRGANETQIMEVTRHKDLRTVRTYIRRANLFKGTPGHRFL